MLLLGLEDTMIHDKLSLLKTDELHLSQKLYLVIILTDRMH